jgi:hypothetical protein
MIKATGRLTFPTLSRLLDHVPDNFDFVADARVWRTPWKKHAIPFIGTQLILFRHDFYQQYLQATYDEMAATRWPRQRPLVEPFFYRKLSQLPQDPMHPRLLRFPCSVDPVGQPAHFRSRSYSHPAQRAANLFRAAMRRTAPGWWL